MIKFFTKSFLSILLLSTIGIDAEAQNKTIEVAELPTEVMPMEALVEQQQIAQPQLVPLSKEESQELLKNLSQEETELLNKFLEALTKKLESLKDESIVTEMAEVFAVKGISWNVTLSVYPCKQEMKMIETVENDMILS